MPFTNSICSSCLLAFNTQSRVECIDKRCQGTATVNQYHSFCKNFTLSDFDLLDTMQALEILTTPCGALLSSDVINHLSDKVINDISSGRSPSFVEKKLRQFAREEILADVRQDFSDFEKYPFLDSIYIARTPYFLLQKIVEKNPLICFM